MHPLPTILEIQPYIGGDVTPPGMSRRVVLASNESPLGPSPLVLERMKNHPINLASYPSGGASKLRHGIAVAHDLSWDHIICGNGSEEIIHMLAQTFIHPGDEVLMPRYGFLVYRIATLASGARPVFFEQNDLLYHVDSILKAVTPRTKILFLDNPANPLGCVLTKEELMDLRMRLPESVFLVLDEAYAEFVEDSFYASGLTLFKDNTNVMTLRTFSKIYGLAGLRTGWGYTKNEGVLDALNRIRAPFNVNTMAQDLATIAVHDQDHVKKVKNHNTLWRNYTKNALVDMGYAVNPSHGNFILFHTHTKERSLEIYRFLGERGIMIRPVGGYDLFEHLRVSIGKEDEMKEFISLMKEITQ